MIWEVFHLSLLSGRDFVEFVWFLKPLLDAAAKSLQSSPTLQPHRRQPTRLLCPQDSLGKNTGVGCHFLLCLLDKPTKLSRPKVFWASLVAQRVKHLPAMQETWVQSLVRKDPLEMEMARHSSTLAWKMPWMEETGRLWDPKEPYMTEQLHFIWTVK